MLYKETTQIPNSIIDINLRVLTLSEIKILLVVLRQTLGWVERKTHKRKYKDWISNKYFRDKTGLSTKSISQAITGLIDKKLIVALDHKNNELMTSENRKGKKKIYFSYYPVFMNIKTGIMVKSIKHHFTIYHRQN